MRQIAQPRGNFIEKILRDSQGRLVRATFCVYECGGHVKARLLSVVYLQENKEIENKPFILGFPTPSVGKYRKFVFDRKIVSPYLDLNLLYSFGSIPRAPTFCN